MNFSNTHAVVIAGGSGTRFWPLSRKKFPKQLLDFGHGSLLSQTFARMQGLVANERLWMVVGHLYADVCRQQVPEVIAQQILVEPVAKNTAPAIALAAIHVAHADPNSVMMVFPADQYITDVKRFQLALGDAVLAAQKGLIVTLGITATFPATGYGYIERSTPAADFKSIYKVRRFCEKPDKNMAQEFIEQGQFDWNAGIFIFKPSVILQEMKRQLPDLYAAMLNLSETIGTKNYETQLQKTFTTIQGVSIDYGIMEKAQHMAVRPVECGWSDVGSWDVLGAVVQPDQHDNVASGNIILKDSTNCITYATPGHVVGIVGMHDTVVVHTPDATLVMPKERAQDVRAIIAELEKQRAEQFL